MPTLLSISMSLSLLTLISLPSFTTTTNIYPKTYAALGDSYASGDGAGSSHLLPSFDLTCGRFNHSYPMQIYNSSLLGIPSSGFKNLACGGASSLSVLKLQVPHIKGFEVVSITVGGNEVDFFALMNACVHEYYFPNGGCERAMKRARALALSNAFLEGMEAMVKGALEVINPHQGNQGVGEGKLLVTGYARFFNDTTSQCDTASFSRRNPDRYLTKELRREFNQMVEMVNAVIRGVVEANDGAIYVDIDSLFAGHRFCEEGVIEPAERDETWFFNMKYASDEERLVKNGERLEETLPGPIRGAGNDQDVPQWLLPGPIKDFFDLTRTFHPTTRGHKAIADAIIDIIT